MTIIEIYSLLQQLNLPTKQLHEYMKEKGINKAVRKQSTTATGEAAAKGTSPMKKAKSEGIARQSTMGKTIGVENK